MKTFLKKCMRLTALISLASLALCAQRVFADTAHFYVGADLGRTQFASDGPRDAEVFAANQDFKASTDYYNLHLGFEFNDWFAIEAAYVDFGKAKDRFKLRGDVVFVVSPNDTQTITARGAAVSGVFSYKPVQDISLFGVLGVIALDYKINESGGFSPITGDLANKNNTSDQGLLYGVGAKYALNESFNLRADLRRHDVSDLSLDTLSIGLEYTF